MHKFRFHLYLFIFSNDVFSRHRFVVVEQTVYIGIVCYCEVIIILCH